MSEQIKLDALLGSVKDGDEHGWPQEFDWLRENHAARLRALIHDILHVGIREPVLIGPDHRVWDGHHRIYAAWALGFEYVPVKYARPL